MSRLKLTRPLAFIDLETTGANPFEDRIVEIAIVRLFPDGRRERFVSRVNPERSIPAAATRIHGIGDDDVRDQPKFAQLAPQVVQLLRGVDLGGFNVARFDLPLLFRELERARVKPPDEVRYVADAQVIFHRMEPRDLAAALRFYCGREHQGAHGALADAEAALDVLLAQIDRYAEGERRLPDRVEELDAISMRRDENFLDPDGKLVWDEDEAVIGFGKHRGTSLRKLRESAPEYLEWILRKDFSDEVKAIVRNAVRGEFPKR
ncbi:MAG: 3'-5' exonuclease [Deltaproteobacteria bacterium]|nr:3'-5' exonuclease [Deltaproteobacteria bacterium]